MKTIKKPLIYFLIWAACTAILLVFGHGHIASVIIFMIISLLIHTIAYYHIIFSNDEAIKEKEPELYAELENKVRQIPIHGPEINAASCLLFSGRAKNYPTIRTQVIEFLAYTVFSLLLTFTVFGVLILIL